MARLRIARIILILPALGAALLVAATSVARADVDCSYVVAPGGSDSAAGDVAAPLRTVEELLDRLEPSEAGCLREGTYASRQFRVKTPEVKLTSYPGERPTLRGRLRFEASARGAVVENLMLDGRNEDNLLGPLIYADGVVLRGNEITNHNTAICVHVDDYPGESEPQGVLIENNRIHHCGRLPATNHDHGIYIARARGTVVRGNVIYANADRGVQMYPDADGTLVTGNVIDGNGQGVIFGGGGDSSSDNNLVEGNVITNSTIRYNIESHWQGPTGTGNVARNNCVWTESSSHEGSPEGSGIKPGMSGASSSRNRIARPQYADARAGNLSLPVGSSCASMLASSSGVPPSEDASRGKGASGGAACSLSRPDDERRLRLRGTRRGDRLSDGPAVDRIRGMGGNDRIRAHRGGRDCLFGGRGRDRVYAVDGRRDNVRCGRGRDVAMVDRKDRVRQCERVVRLRP